MWNPIINHEYIENLDTVVWNVNMEHLKVPSRSLPTKKSCLRGINYNGCVAYSHIPCD